MQFQNYWDFDNYPLKIEYFLILKCTKAKIFLNILLRNFCCCFRVSIEIQCMKVAIATSKFLNNCFSSEQLQYHAETRVKWRSWKESDQLQAPNQLTPRFSQTQHINFQYAFCFLKKILLFIYLAASQQMLPALCELSVLGQRCRKACAALPSPAQQRRLQASNRYWSTQTNLLGNVFLFQIWF